MKQYADLNTEAIRKMFRDYVENADGKPRHSQEARYQAGMFSSFLDGAIPYNMKLRDAIYARMMDCAVEYEQSGFIAGVRFVLNRFEDITEALRIGNYPIQSEAEAERQADTAQKGRQNPETADDTPADTEEEQVNACISSKQIAEIFESTNAKVVRRIEERIMPNLDAQSQQYFRMDVKYTPQNRRYKIYYLNKTACDLYMAEMEPHKKFISIAGGLVKMRELMKKVFPLAAAS